MCVYIYIYNVYMYKIGSKKSSDCVVRSDCLQALLWRFVEILYERITVGVIVEAKRKSNISRDHR